MIQDIHPHQFENSFIIASGIREDDHIFYFKENSLLFKQAGEVFEIPKKNDFTSCSSEGIFLFTLNNVRCFLVWDCPEFETGYYSFHEIKFLHTISQKEIDWASGVALQLKNWYEQNKFCGKCGGLTRQKVDERALYCPSCQNILFPGISPAIIVAILRNDKILLARGANFRDGYFALVAGYVDIGESIEDAVRREVKEEVGIQIKNIRYYQSQPWPFSGSMMIGFVAEADQNQTIRVDNTEIIEAAWFKRGNLPNHPPIRSIAGEIIEKFEKNEL